MTERCTHCQGEFATVLLAGEKDDRTDCPSCGAPHHAKCIEKTGRCSSATCGTASASDGAPRVNLGGIPGMTGSGMPGMTGSVRAIRGPAAVLVMLGLLLLVMGTAIVAGAIALVAGVVAIVARALGFGGGAVTFTRFEAPADRPEVPRLPGGPAP